MFQNVIDSFNNQGFMKHLGAKIIFIEEGFVKISCEKNYNLTQQNGFFHAGVLTSIMDSASGYAALTKMPKDSEVLSVEFKTNLMRPAKADKIIAIAKVVKSGKTLTFCEAKITDEKEEIIFATLQGTMFCVPSK